MHSDRYPYKKRSLGHTTREACAQRNDYPGRKGAGGGHGVEASEASSADTLILTSSHQRYKKADLCY